MHSISITMLIISPTHEQATELQHIIYLQKTNIQKYVFKILQYGKFLLM